MYKCNIPGCRAAFESPMIVREPVPYGEQSIVMEERVCPACGGADYSEADRCECGEWKSVHELLCRKCQTALSEKFNAFADCLTYMEECQLDEWIEINGIDHRLGFVEEN